MKKRNELSLTEEICDSIKYAGNKNNEYYDGSCLLILVRKSGVKDWVVRCRRNYTNYRVYIGRYPEISLEKAREICNEVVAEFEANELPPRGYAYSTSISPKHVKDESVRNDPVLIGKVLTVRDEPLAQTVSELEAEYGSTLEAARYKVEQYREVCPTYEALDCIIEVSTTVLAAICRGTYNEGKPISPRLLKRLGVLPWQDPVCMQPETIQTEAVPPVKVEAKPAGDDMPDADTEPKAYALYMLDALATKYKDDVLTIVIIQAIKKAIA